MCDNFWNGKTMSINLYHFKVQKNSTGVHSKGILWRHIWKCKWLVLVDLRGLWACSTSWAPEEKKHFAYHFRGIHVNRFVATTSSNFGKSFLGMKSQSWFLSFFWYLSFPKVTRREWSDLGQEKCNFPFLRQAPQCLELTSQRLTEIFFYVRRYGA